MSQKACFLQCNKLPNPLSHLMYPLLFQGLHATGSKPTVWWRFNQTITKVTVYRPERHTAVACRGSWSSSWWISKSMLDHCPVVYHNLISVSLSWLNASFLHAKFAKSYWNLFLPAYKDAANDKISSVHQHSETVQPHQSVKASSSCSAVMWVFCFLLNICANLWRCSLPELVLTSQIPFTLNS